MIEIGPCLDVAIDADAHAALVLRPNGGLDHYDYPSFRLRARYRLPQPGYRAASGPSGRLYVAVSDPDALRFNPNGRPPEGRGDLHVYDLRLGRGSVPLATDLKPTAVIPLDASVRSLLCSPDRSCVYFLAGRAKEARVGRVPTAGPQEALRRDLPNAAALALSPDGRRLCAGGFDYFAVLDTDTLEARTTRAITAAVSDVAVDDSGRVFIGEEGPTPQLTAFNKEGRAIHQLQERIPGRIYLRLQKNSTRLFFSSSSFLEGGLRSLLVKSDFFLEGPVVTLDRNRELLPSPEPVRGEFILAPDGDVLITHTGKVYRLVEFRNGAL